MLANQPWPAQNRIMYNGNEVLLPFILQFRLCLTPPRHPGSSFTCYQLRFPHVLRYAPKRPSAANDV